MSSFNVGDLRLDRRGQVLFDQIVETGSLVLHRIGGDRGGEVAAGRFFGSAKVTPQSILAPSVARTAAAAAGRRVLAIEDTTEINFSGRDRRRSGLGPAADGKSLGFFIHALIAVDAVEEALLGVVDAKIWSRTEPPKRRQTTPVEEKESMRWIDGMTAAAGRLSGAASIIVVADRESDHYPMLARVPEGVDLLIRCRHDRKLGDGGTLSEASAAFDILATTTLDVPSRGPGDKGRVANVTLKAGRVTIPKPVGKVTTADPAELTIGLVVVEEIAPPPGVKPVVWRLYTTLPVGTREEAGEAVRLYRLRWRIEQVFRSLKSDGLALEETQVQSAGRLFKLAAMGLAAAARIIQLVDARDGSNRPATDVIDAALIAPAAEIGARLEGRTERQKNHFPQGSLAWLAWIVARLGGWNCYYKPPGPKTMAIGWRQLAAMFAGYVIADATGEAGLM